MFNKKEYWKRRKKGLRGQGLKIRPKFEEYSGNHFVDVGSGITFVNRSQARRMSRGKRIKKPMENGNGKN